MSLCSNRTKRRIQKVGCHAENGWRNSFLSGIIHSCVLNDSREILNLRFPEIVLNNELRNELHENNHFAGHTNVNTLDWCSQNILT